MKKFYLIAIVIALLASAIACKRKVETDKSTQQSKYHAGDLVINKFGDTVLIVRNYDFQEGVQRFVAERKDLKENIWSETEFDHVIE